MKMPSKIKLISNGRVTELNFSHALNVLRLQQSQGRADWSIESLKFEFKKNEIVRIKSNKKDKKKAE
jgi:hypothetical protein